MIAQKFITLLKWIGLYERQRKWREVPVSIRFVNFIFQRILRINGNCPWSVHFTSRIIHSQKIYSHASVETYLALSGHLYINGQNGIFIDEGTIIAPGVKIISANHDITNLKEHKIDKPIYIGRDCWLSANAIILPGVSLGEGVVVAAGAVVTESFESNSLLAGVPARLIRKL